MPYKYNILGQGWHFPQENISSSDIIKFQGRINAYYSSDQELQTDIRNVYLPFFSYVVTCFCLLLIMES